MALYGGVEDFIGHQAIQESLDDFWYGRIIFAWDSQFLMKVLVVLKVN